jgi:type IV pilus assembly protein PilO
MAEGSNSRRSAILLGLLVVGGGGYAGYEYLYKPRAAEIQALETRLEGLQMENRTARILTEQDGEDSGERQLTSYRAQLQQVEGLIPSSEEVPDLLDAIAGEAQRTGVDLALIQPVAAVAETYYTRRTYDLAVLGSYHQIGAFLTRVGSLPRIVTPVNLNVIVRNEETRSGDPQLEARFSIETYVLPASYGINDAAVPQ